MPSSHPSDIVDLPQLPIASDVSASGARSAATVVGTGLACFVAQWVSVLLWVPPAQVSAVWVPGGLLLGICLLTPTRRWPTVLTTGALGVTLLFVTLRLVPPAGAIVLGALTGLQTAALALALRAVLRHPFPPASIREFLLYLIVVVAGGAVVASMLFLAGVWGMALRPPTFTVWRTFALAAVLGYLLATPTVVLLVREAATLRRVVRQNSLEAGLLAGLLALAWGLVSTGTTNRTGAWAAFAVTLPPLLLWSAIRFNMLGASAALLLVAVFSTWTTSRGLGPFTGQSSGDNTLSVQLFVLGIGLPVLGLAVVLDEQKRMTAALRASQVRLRTLTRELIAAREEEATRIARELHDDIGQRLALVSIGLGRLRRTSASTVAGPLVDVVQLQERLQQQTSSIARSLRQISHQLHPAMLEQLGLSSALQLKCEEVRQATGMDLRMVNEGDTGGIPGDVALCVFRVAQEALSNAARHSGAHNVDVSLRREGTALVLQVTDDGHGFPAGPPDQSTGLGLHSSTERVRAVGGSLTIDSAPGAGTTLRATVPL